MNRPVEELRPGELLALVRDTGLALLPVSPLLEWHSYHLPLGVDGLIVERVARELGARLPAAWFRSLSLGLDEVRDETFKRTQGLPVTADVFGMNYPTLPLASEYVGEPVFRSMVAARLRMARAAGFRHVFLLNHHGGRGQQETLDELARGHSGPAFACAALRTTAFAPEPPEGDDGLALAVGGHAGLAETIQCMAFCPELIDTAQLPDGALSAAQTGILHDEPQIPARFHPRHADPARARAWGEGLLANLERHIRSVALQNG